MTGAGCLAILESTAILHPRAILTRFCDFLTNTKVFYLWTIDIIRPLCYKKPIIETVDAGVKPIMLSQRVREAESRAKHRSCKWAAEGAVKGGS